MNLFTPLRLRNVTMPNRFVRERPSSEKRAATVTS